MDRSSPAEDVTGNPTRISIRESRPGFLVALGLLPPCSPEDVHRAYKARAAILHPDQGGVLADFLKLQEAYAQAQEYAKSQEGRRKWLASQVEPYVAQQEIITEVERRGGRAQIEQLAWMKESFGDFATLAERLRGIVLHDDAEADELLRYLAEQAPHLRHLRDIDLTGSLVSDAGIECLCLLRGLERVNLESTLVTETGIVALAELPELKWVNVGDASLRWWTRWQLGRNHPRLMIAKGEG
ncbi:MAG TPA: hypothetical protein VGH74_13200 [Planctomycetaceae bacterium]